MSVSGESNTSYRISATNISSYHYYKCDLFLHNSYYKRYTKNYGAEQSKLVKARLKRGIVLESQLLSWLDKQSLLARSTSVGILDAANIQALIELDERKHFYITGLRFYPPNEALRIEYERNGNQLPNFSIAKPDLLEVERLDDGSIQWQILDIKSSMSVKASHHAQVYFYHLCMQYILLSQHYVPKGVLSVWLLRPSHASVFEPSFEDIKSYPIEILAPSLRKFLFDCLPTILRQNQHDVKWHYNPLCQGCPFESSCRTRAALNHELGSIANMTIQDAEVLRTILDLERPVNVSGGLSDVEDLDLIVRSEFTVAKLYGSYYSTMRRAQKILALPTKLPLTTQDSPIIAATLLNRVQVMRRRSYTFPKSEDMAIIISLINDPLTSSPKAFCITTHSSFSVRDLPTVECGRMEHFTSRLSGILKTIFDVQNRYEPPIRTQVYVFKPNEKEEIQRHLINTALTSDLSDPTFRDCLKLCIGALCEGASLLSTSFQPLILSGALLEFLGKDEHKTIIELRNCSERLGLPITGTDKEIVSRIRAEISRLKAEGNRTNVANIQRAEIGLLLRIVIVKSEVQRLLALPAPGYWDLSECFSNLCPGSALLKCPTDEQLLAHLLEDKPEDLEKIAHQRNVCIYDVIRATRSLLTSSDNKINDSLVNDARLLTSNFLDVCKHDHLRKLFNMHQVEVLAKLTTIWQDRIEGCPDSPVLEYHYSDGSNLHKFTVKSGLFDFSADKVGSFYEFILTEDGNCESIPVEAFFDDLAVFNVVFPLNKKNEQKWLSQPEIIQSSLLVADVADVFLRGTETVVTLRTYGNLRNGFRSGKTYRFSPRLVDFNVAKILDSLLEIDLQASSISDGPTSSLPPFLQLCTNPYEFIKQFNLSSLASAAYVESENNINKFFSELPTKAAEALILQPSQRKAICSVLANKLTVIWGPPGTGKSYTVSMSILRLLEIESRHQTARSQIILLSALTHAAIQACLNNLQQLRKCYQSIPDVSKQWLDSMIIEHVTRGIHHPEPRRDKTYVYAGTVYQLYNFCKRFNLKSDCVILDEAGQLGLGAASLVLRSLKEDGRVIVAGDSEQLGPMFSAEYPLLEARLFGSILDCLMGALSHMKQGQNTESRSLPNKKDSEDGVVVQLTENFRLNEDLGDFVSTIYKEKFKPQKTQTKDVASTLMSLEALSCHGQLESTARAYLVALSKAMLRIPQTTLIPPKFDKAKPNESELGFRPISLSLLRTNFVAAQPRYPLSYEDHVALEASLAASLVNHIQKVFPGQSIIVVTPQRTKRQSVNKALISHNLEEAFGLLQLSSGPAAKGDTKGPLIRVDTVERLQGSEAAFVICLFSHPSSSEHAGGVHFLLQRHRLNVAISRARTLCILITSSALLTPDPGIFTNSESTKGYMFLKDYESRAWVGDIDMRLEDLSNQ